MKKKILAMLLATVLTLSITACGGDKDSSASDSNEAFTATEETDASEETAETGTEETAEEETNAETSDENADSTVNGLADFPNTTEQDGATIYSAEDGSLVMVMPYNEMVDDSLIDLFESKSDLFSVTFNALFESLITSMTEGVEEVKLGNSGFKDINGRNVFAFEATADGQSMIVYMVVNEESAYILLGADQGTPVENALNELLDTL